MFDISWTEFLLIGVVALVVIGPKELPGVLRTLGQWTRKMRAMASEFQGQFQEVMREAEMADLKKQVDEIASDIKGYDPLKSVREDVESIGSDIKTGLSDPAEQKPADFKPVELKPAEFKPEETALDSSPAAALPAPGEGTPTPAVEALQSAPPSPEPVTASGEPVTTERR